MNRQRIRQNGNRHAGWSVCHTGISGGSSTVEPIKGILTGIMAAKILLVCVGSIGCRFDSGPPDYGTLTAILWQRT